MPIHEYRCGKCGYEQEIITPVNSLVNPSKTMLCPKCQRRMDRQISVTANMKENWRINGSNT
ncbi:MAG: zinc ribbon domain-containing protein [Candidatus Brocadiales bacterium]|nr:zinc ribbon domain-containing protein [Candidatus Brocadiales bacterium]